VLNGAAAAEHNGVLKVAIPFPYQKEHKQIPSDGEGKME
jgi:hypothetical protein